MALSAKQLLLIDGLGAVLTATLLSQVLARWQPLFGMPHSMLYGLAGIATCFAVYSLGGYFLLRQGHARYLRAIAIANILYCLLTLWLIAYLPALTSLGVAQQ